MLLSLIHILQISAFKIIKKEKQIHEIVWIYKGWCKNKPHKIRLSKHELLGWIRVRELPFFRRKFYRKRPFILANWFNPLSYKYQHGLWMSLYQTYHFCLYGSFFPLTFSNEILPCEWEFTLYRETLIFIFLFLVSSTNVYVTSILVLWDIDNYVKRYKLGISAVGRLSASRY